MARISNPKYEFNIMDYGIDIPRSNVEEARQAVKEFVLDKVLEYVGDAKSPVAGEGGFVGLDPRYKKIKKKISGSSKANLELYGNMLDALDIKVNGNKLTLLVNDSDQAGKSDGHNNFSGQSPLPQRRFIPDEDQEFDQEIENGIQDILRGYERD